MNESHMGFISVSSFSLEGGEGCNLLQGSLILSRGRRDSWAGEHFFFFFFAVSFA